MLQKLVTLTVLILLLLSTQIFSESQLQIRAWQLHEYDIEYCQQAIDLAPDYDVTHIVFSHNLIWYTEEMLEAGRRGRQINELAARAHRRGMKAWIWTHEVHGVPEEFLKNGKVTLDNPEFWKWEKEKYRTLFQRFENIDGMILTFHETTYKIYHDVDAISVLPEHERVTKLINTINDACKEFGKDLIVRTFAYEPAELDWIKKGLEKVDKRVIVESKVVPHEWNPYYPHNPLIGAFPERKQIIEFHSAAEIGGYNMTPYPHPEYFQMRMKYDLEHGACGYITRIDVGDYQNALGTPNELNMYTLYRLAENPETNTEDIWYDWAVDRYGEVAAPYAISALKRAFDISNKTYYTLDFWITDHTKFPSYNYADGHISSRTVAKWIPTEKYKKLEDDLNNPYPELLEEILAEKDEAIALCRESLIDIEKGQMFFHPEDYNDLHWRFMLDLNATIIWKYFNEAFFGYKILENHYSKPLYDRVVRAVNSLERWASINESEFGEDVIPGNPARIRSFVKEMREKIKDLK